MKKTLIVTALALSFAASAAYAQTDTPPPPPKAPPAAGPEAAPPPPPPPHHPGPEAMRGPDRGPGHGPWMKHHMMMMSKGARIRVSDGDIHVNVKCAEDDSTADCGQTVIRILREVQSLDSADEGGGKARGDDGDDMENE